VETLWQDFRYAVRMLLKRPGFTVVAVLSLTLGIGANTTIFTLVKAVFLQSVPIKDASRVISLYSTQESKDGTQIQYLQLANLNAQDFREKNDVFSGSAIVIPTGADLDVSGKQVQVFAELVNGNFFDVLGVQPRLGRYFLPDEDQTPGARPVVVLSTALWNTQFGADPKILGQNIRLNSQDYTVVGVAPADFHNIGVLQSPDAWIPMMMHDQVLTGTDKEWYTDRGARLVWMVGRLKPRVTFARAEASVHALATDLQREYPKDNSGRSVQLLPIDETNIQPQLRGIFRLAGTLMMVVVGLVLLIACANVANLLLARATQRQREIAIRQAMGASRSRLIRQLLTESLLLGLLAAGFGVLCAYWVRPVLFSLLLNNRPNLDVSIDARVLIFTLGLAVAATMLFGLAPALQASKPSQLTALRDRTDAPTGSTRWYGLRGALVMLQVAFSLIALVGAGLFIHSLRNAQQVDPGFETKHELVMFLNLGAEHYTQPQAEQFHREVLERVRALPMVAEASFSGAPPFGGGLQRTTFPDSVDTNDPRNGKLTPIVAVAPGYFSAAGIALRQGREFDDHDDANAAQVAVVNQALADNVWPGRDPLGKHLHFLGETWNVEVVGVVRTVKYQSLGEPPQPIVYFALKQHYSPFVTLYVRTRSDPNAALASVRSTVQSVDKTLPIRRVLAVSAWLDLVVLQAPRMGAELLACFGLLALLLAAVGTYGVMSYSVNQRTHEIGVRMALGAQPGNVMRLMLGGGMAMVPAGVFIGLAISTALTRSLSSLLFNVGNFDLVTFTGTSALLLLVALVACWLPARRAMTVDPMIALRYE
jgi:predicted permease